MGVCLKMNEIDNYCECCYKVKEKHELFSLCSFSVSGNVVISYVCKDCLNDTVKLDRLMSKNDRKLNVMDFGHRV